MRTVAATIAALALVGACSTASTSQAADEVTHKRVEFTPQDLTTSPVTLAHWTVDLTNYHERTGDTLWQLSETFPEDDLACYSGCARYIYQFDGYQAQLYYSSPTGNTGHRCATFTALWMNSDKKVYAQTFSGCLPEKKVSRVRR